MTKACELLEAQLAGRTINQHSFRQLHSQACLSAHSCKNLFLRKKMPYKRVKGLTRSSLLGADRPCKLSSSKHQAPNFNHRSWFACVFSKWEPTATTIYRALLIIMVSCRSRVAGCAQPNPSTTNAAMPVAPGGRARLGPKS